MELYPADYVILAAFLGSAAIGLFVGFSGALAFLVAGIGALTAGYFSYAPLTGFCPNAYLSGTLSFVASLLAFGICRYLVRKLVHFLLAQPADAVLGACISGVSASVLSIGVCWLLRMVFPEADCFVSAILERVMGYVG